jgi:hypothetical protein
MEAHYRSERRAGVGSQGLQRGKPACGCQHESLPHFNPGADARYAGQTIHLGVLTGQLANLLRASSASLCASYRPNQSRVVDSCRNLIVQLLVADGKKRYCLKSALTFSASPSIIFRQREFA